MAERPLLLLPAPTPAARAKKGGGGGGPAPLGQARQQARIGPRLDELEAAFEAKRLTLQTSAAGLVPEEVLVANAQGFRYFTDADAFKHHVASEALAGSSEAQA